MTEEGFALSYEVYQRMPGVDSFPLSPRVRQIGGGQPARKLLVTAVAGLNGTRLARAATFAGRLEKAKIASCLLDIGRLWSVNITKLLSK